jgi:hypothetical protein
MARVAGVSCAEFRVAWESLFRAAACGNLSTTEERACAALARIRRPANRAVITKISAIEEQFQERAAHLYPDARSTLRRLRGRASG